jgi:hypothetical protein
MRDRLTYDEELVLGPYIDIAKQGEGSLKPFFDHVGIPDSDVTEAADVMEAILTHYRRADGDYDIEMLRRDWTTYEPAMLRIIELGQAQARCEADCKSSKE